ncbi:MAG: hypothetical protein HY329_10230 [Chloroflexi bacterium]|nr:hypothetical protein [Chloroflexota bacterium]
MTCLTAPRPTAAPNAEIPASDLLRELAAEPASSQPLAEPLVRFALARGLAAAELASYLGLSPARLHALMLCVRPASEPELERLAAYFGADYPRLAAALR